MKMQNNDLFPSVEPSTRFKHQLKSELIDVYHRKNAGSQAAHLPLFWRWVSIPAVALGVLALVLLRSSGPMRSPDINLPLSTPQVSESTSVSLSDAQSELDELTASLESDAELDEAIAFSDL